MSTSVFLWTVSVVPLTVVAVFAMKYASAAVQARTRRTEDLAYRSIAEGAAAAQAQTAAALSAVRSDLLSLSTRLAAMETILKQVE